MTVCVSTNDYAKAKYVTVIDGHSDYLTTKLWSDDYNNFMSKVVMK